MTLSELFYLISWDMRMNRGFSFDRVRAKILLIEIRLEQFVYRNFYRGDHPLSLLWYLFRFPGTILQWFLCNSNIPGSTTIGRGLRLPHPQNIIIAAFTSIGEFCTVYQNVSIIWNGFLKTVPCKPSIGNQVLIGTGAIIIGDITVGSDVLIAAGTTVYHSVPDHSRVTSAHQVNSSRSPSEMAADPGSERHIQEPYSVWR